MFKECTFTDRLSQWLAAALLVSLTGCVHRPVQRVEVAPRGAAPDSRATVNQLSQDLTALAQTVRPEEAQRLASCAWDTSHELAADYQVVGPALFHNFLVNTGFKQRGLCYQWAEDLLAKLQALELVTLELHWGMARAGTYREHNCIVVTAVGQPFNEGLVLDAWRRSGRLVWAPVRSDRYPWIEGELVPSPGPPETSAARARGTQ